MKLSGVAVSMAFAFCTGTGALAQGFAPGVGKDGSIRVPMDDYRKEWSYLGTFSELGENGAAELPRGLYAADHR